MCEQVQVSNIQGFHEEIPIDICDLNNHTFSTLEVKLQNDMIVAINNLTTTLPVAIRSGLVTISIGGAPGKHICQYMHMKLRTDCAYQNPLTPCIIKETPE